MASFARAGKGVRVSSATRRSFATAGKRLPQAARQISKDFGVGLRLIGEEIMTDVKASRPGHGVPVDEGTLRITGRVEGPLGSTATGRTSVSLSFGGAAANYALIQHERTDYRHALGEPRYLVRGLERWKPGGSVAMAAIRANAQAGLAAVGRKGGTRQGRDARRRFTGAVR